MHKTVVEVSNVRADHSREESDGQTLLWSNQRHGLICVFDYIDTIMIGLRTIEESCPSDFSLL